MTDENEYFINNELLMNEEENNIIKNDKEKNNEQINEEINAFDENNQNTIFKIMLNRK